MDEAGTSSNWDDNMEVSFYLQARKLPFCWVRNHVEIGGNEKADLGTKVALNLPRANLRFPYTLISH